MPIQDLSPMKLALASLSATLALPLAAPLQAQSEIAWIDNFNPLSFQSIVPKFAGALPDGGVVSLFRAETASGPAGDELFIMDLLDENGERLHTVLSSLVIDQVESPLIDFNVSPAGDLVLLRQRSGRIVFQNYNVDPAFQFEQILPSPIAGIRDYAIGVGFTAGSDILVASAVDEPNQPPFSGVMSLRRIDRSTGGIVWGRSRSSVFDGMASAFGDDSAVIVYRTPATLMAERIDSSGAQIYLTPVPWSNTIPGAAEWAVLSDDGQLIVRVHVSSSSPGGGALISLDPTGAHMWEAPLPPTDIEATFTTSGDIVYITETGDAARIDGATGVTEWTGFAPAGSGQYHGLSADHRDGFVYAVSNHPNSTTTGIGTLILVDAQGDMHLEQFPEITADFGQIGDVEFDVRGNAIVTASARTTQSIEGDTGRTIKVVPTESPGFLSCSQPTPNSTGQTSNLTVAGFPQASANNITLIANDMPPDVSVLFLTGQGVHVTPGPAGSLGDLCLGGQLGRYAQPGQVRTTTEGGLASLQLDLTMTPSGSLLRPVMSGEAWNFQAWHRDIVGGSSSASNFTNAVIVVFQ